MDRVLNWLTDYSYGCVLLAAAIDATALPFPGRLVLVAAGTLAAAGRIDLLGALVSGATGAVTGDHLWYFGGRFARGRLEKLYRWLSHRHGSSTREANRYLERHGGVAIIVGRFVAAVRVLVWPMASAHGIGYGRFLVWDLAAGALWAGTLIGGGYVLGRPAIAAMERFGGLALALGGLVLAALGGVALFWRRRGGPHRGRRTPRWR